MTNEQEPENAIGSFLDKINLPKLVAGPAGEAISRLIGGAVDIPAAYMNQVAQGIKDKTEAKSAVSKAVANAASDLAKSDPDLVERAAQTFLAKELRKQHNKETVAKKTLEKLQQDHTDGAAPQPENKVDDDWLNVFERYAENASSEKMQDLWARVLAGQIRQANKFSLQTMRFVSELDEGIAQLFEKFSTSVIQGDFIPYPPNRGAEFTELLWLSEAGLISNPGTQLSKSFEVGPGGVPFPYKNGMVLVDFSKKTNLAIPCILLTRIGREVLQLTTAEVDEARIKAFASQFPKDGVTKIRYLAFPKDAASVKALGFEVLWETPQATPSGPTDTSPVD